MSDATSQRVALGSGSGLAPVECPGNVQRVSKYATIVADPPWAYDSWPVNRGTRKGQRDAIPYPTMSIYQIAALPVAELADKDAHLYLWTTQRYLRDAFMVAEAWGFRYSTTLVWAKPPLGIGPGGTFAPSAEFVLFCRRGTLKAKERLDRCWWSWQRTHEHSRKPDAFLDTVEQVSPGPYLELFARRQRLGWDTWGNEALLHVDLGGQSEDIDPLQSRSGSQSA